MLTTETPPPPTVLRETPAGVRPRLDSIDFLRGLVMVIMALDHTRDFTSVDLGIVGDPTDLSRTYPALFFTRWITHYCAPTFVFLSGVAAFLSTGRGKSKKDLSWFLITRGFWLVFLELTIIHWSWTFNFNPHSDGGSVIWALGWSMIVLAGLIHLPVNAVGLFGVTMILVHNAFDKVPPDAFGPFGWLWKVLHVPGNIVVLTKTALVEGNLKEVPNFTFGVGYPLIPWMGVMAAGFAFGQIFRWEPERRSKFLTRLGLGMIAAFVIIRYTNVYGDARPWSPQKDFTFSVMSFLNCVKYPPSLMYLLMTLGPGMLVLALLDGGIPKLLRPIVVFGRVPMFYYLLHLPLIHATGLLLGWLARMPTDFWFSKAEPSPEIGWSLPIVYLIWACIILFLYPWCKKMSELKQRNRSAWLSYF